MGKNKIWLFINKQKNRQKQTRLPLKSGNPYIFNLNEGNILSCSVTVKIFVNKFWWHRYWSCGQDKPRVIVFNTTKLHEKRWAECSMRSREMARDCCLNTIPHPYHLTCPLFLLLPRVMTRCQRRTAFFSSGQLVQTTIWSAVGSIVAPDFLGYSWLLHGPNG